MSDPIYNSFTSANLDVTQLMDPDRIKVLIHSVADQMNKARESVSPPMRALDLSDHIADIIIETSAQGASLLEVHIIDPGWMLLQRNKDGVPFIDVDEQGYLWPPVEINFPEGKSDATWRLCQCRPSTDLSGPNIILVFEDKIVAELREHAGPEMSNPNETRAEFIRRLVKKASQNKLFKDDTGIRFVPLLPTDVFSASDLASTEVRLPTSAQHGRKNPNKNPGGGPAVAPGRLSTRDVILGDYNLAKENQLIARG